VSADRWKRVPVAAARLLLCLLLAGVTAGRAAAQERAAAIADCSQASGADQDSDGLSDDCELALARRFAPLLAVARGGCNWDDTIAPGRLAGGYFFAAEPRATGAVLAYLPAYFRDCGWSGPKCWVPGVDCAGHAGDSEFIALELARAQERWSVARVYLSAHCFGRSGADCRWYESSELERFEWEDVAPVIWVAEGRQANYPSRAACDRGHHTLDTCDRNAVRYSFPVTGSAQNAGSSGAPNPASGCVAGRLLGSARVRPDALECFWTPGQPFRGWQGEGQGVTGYHRYLVEVAGLKGP
jgi:hypothetical protein